MNEQFPEGWNPIDEYSGPYVLLERDPAEEGAADPPGEIAASARATARLQRLIAAHHGATHQQGEPNMADEDLEASDTVTEPWATFHTGRIRAATLVDIPAYLEARIESTGPIDDDGFMPWAGVLAVEGIPTGDGRVYTEGSLRWEAAADNDFGKLRWDIEDDGAHMGAVTVGTIQTIERDGAFIRGTGVIDTKTAHGEAAALLLERGTLGGISIDPDDIPEDEVDILLQAAAVGSTNLELADDDTEWDPEEAHSLLVEFATSTDDEGEETIDVGVLSATHLYIPDDAEVMDPASYEMPFASVFDDTLLAVPAGIDWALGQLSERDDLTEEEIGAISETLQVYLERLGETDDDGDGEAEDDGLLEEGLEATAWSEFRSLPALPADAFADPTERLAGTDEYVHYENGRIWGWVAQNGVCHDAFSNACVTPPPEGTDLATFNRQPVELDDGTTVNVGVFTMDTGHDNDGAEVASTKAQFDDTRTVAGLVRVGICKQGTWFAGIAAPWLSEWDLRVLTTCRPSGHWKRLRDGSWSLRAVLSVPVPGFPNRVAASAAVYRSNMALAASAYAHMDEPTEEETALVLADQDRSLLASAIVDEMERRERARAEAARLSADLSDTRRAVARAL